jgi:uncharacterized membrane protein
MPARWLPLLYFTFAHCCLAAAFAELAFEPGSLAGFFYHPRMLAVALQGLAFLLWTAGVPLLALGLAADRTALFSSGAWALLAAVFAGFANAIVVLRRLWRR